MNHSGKPSRPGLRFLPVVLLALASSPLWSLSESKSSESKTGPIDALAASVCQRKLVLLGELPSHGEAGAFQAKAAVVRRLVESCGFDTVVFEAGIYDFIGLERALAEGVASQELLDQAMGRFWTTPDLLDWRRWLLERSRQGKLALAGMDDQLSATAAFARAQLPDLVAAAVPETRSADCREAVDRHVHWSYGGEHPFDDAARETLRSCATEAASRDVGSKTDAVMLDNLSRYLSRPQGRSGAADRDSSMARNLTWIANERAKKSKMVVWTSTVHAARQATKRPFPPMGTLLGEELTSNMASIGFTALKGDSSMAGMPARTLSELPAESLEAVATHPDKPTAWLDRERLQALGPVPSRLFGKPTTADWSHYFDGVWVIREERAPQAP